MMYITDVRLSGNENTSLRKNTLYAELRDEEDGHLVIGASLEYILAEIRDRGYKVRGVSVGHGSRGSVVRLDLKDLA